MWNYKQDFPILNQQIHNKPLVFLDSAASSQKPECVIDSIVSYYSKDHANVHRGVYELSRRATEQYEAARHTVKNFIHADNVHNIIFTKGTTESINLVATSFGQAFVKSGDEILISAMEHHANIVPWQLLCERTGAILKVIPILEKGELDLDAFKKLISSKTKLVAITHASNVLGTINPIKEITAIAHQYNVPVFVDGAQAVPHFPVDVQELDCDFYAFSSHKAYGPTGVGVLYGKSKWFDQMPPYQAGGDMIETVSFEKSTFQKVPLKFEAGTPNIADVIAFSQALNYLKNIGMENIYQHEQTLLRYATEKLAKIPDIKIIGEAPQKVGVISFVFDDIHPHDIGTILDFEGIAVRAGHHCAMPLMQHFKIPACTRASFGLYNDEKDVDALVEGLLSVKRLFG